MANNNLIARLDNENIVIVDEINDHAVGENSGVFDETTNTLHPFGGGSAQYIPINAYHLQTWDDTTSSYVDIDIYNVNSKLDKIYLNNAGDNLTLAAYINGLADAQLLRVNDVLIKQNNETIPYSFNKPQLYGVDIDDNQYFFVGITINTESFIDDSPVDVYINVSLASL